MGYFFEVMFCNISKPLIFTTWTNANSAMVLSAVFGLVAALIVHFAIRQKRFTRRIRSRLSAYANWTPLLLRSLTGVLLFTGSLLGFLFMPALQLDRIPLSANMVLLAIEFVVGLGLIIGVFPRFMSVMAVTLFLIAFFVFPPLSVLPYIGLLGIFIYLFIIGDPFLPRVRGEKTFSHLFSMTELVHLKPYAMAMLRISAGASMVMLGFIYGVCDPSYALEYLRINSANFMIPLGFTNFTNDVFVLAAGVGQILTGLLIMLGLLPRLIGGALLIILIVSIPLFGMYDLFSHFPYYAVCFALLTQGGGQRWSAEPQKGQADKKQ